MTTADLLREAADLMGCPWCGATPATWDEPGETGSRRHYVGCVNISVCKVEPTLFARTASGAIAAWNTRAAADRAPEQGRDVVPSDDDGPDDLDEDLQSFMDRDRE